MIPKIIWQTYKTKFEDLPEKAASKAQSWKSMNPDYDYIYLDDDAMFEFVKDKYGQEVLDIFNSFKVPVMKADLWRYLVIYKYGGVYADIDTECIKPLSEWIDLDHNMIVAPENGTHYIQYFFAASQENPVIKSVIDTLLSRCKDVDYNMLEFIHYHTGPAVFTDGIRSYFNLNDLSHNCEYMSEYNNCFHTYLQDEAKTYIDNSSMQENKFFCYSDEQQDIFKDGNVKHHFGSYYWRHDPSYQSWIEDPLAKKSRNY